MFNAINNKALFDVFGMQETSIYASLVFFSILYSPISMIMGVFFSIISRKNEFAADKYGLIDLNATHHFETYEVKDDKGRNILYKNCGEERYPDFKLYKMIARNVHNHRPEQYVDHIVFKRFVSNRKKCKKKRTDWRKAQKNS